MSVDFILSNFKKTSHHSKIRKVQKDKKKTIASPQFIIYLIDFSLNEKRKEKSFICNTLLCEA